jgi:carbon monoxide dehydrogenase subunit G
VTIVPGRTIRVSKVLDAPPEHVWALLANIESHVEWMHDAVAIDFTSAAHRGVGTTFDCDTKIGPLRLTDRMEITEWVDAQLMGVRHVGVVTGTGRFTLEPVGLHHTKFTWEERLEFPWWMGGALGAFAGAPVLTQVWKRNLRELAVLVRRRRT